MVWVELKRAHLYEQRSHSLRSVVVSGDCVDHLYSIDQHRNNVFHGNLLEVTPEAIIMYSNRRPTPQRNRSAFFTALQSYKETYSKTDFSQYFNKHLH